MVSERTQSQKAICCTFTFTEITRIGKPIEKERLVVSRFEIEPNRSWVTYENKFKDFFWYDRML